MAKSKDEKKVKGKARTKGLKAKSGGKERKNRMKAIGKALKILRKRGFLTGKKTVREILEGLKKNTMHIMPALRGNPSGRRKSTTAGGDVSGGTDGQM